MYYKIDILETEKKNYIHFVKEVELTTLLAVQ